MTFITAGLNHIYTEVYIPQGTLIYRNFTMRCIPQREDKAVFTIIMHILQHYITCTLKRSYTMQSLMKQGVVKMSIVG